MFEAPSSFIPFFYTVTWVNDDGVNGCKNCAENYKHEVQCHFQVSLSTVATLV
jgi:hypothetical protein